MLLHVFLGGSRASMSRPTTHGNLRLMVATGRAGLIKWHLCGSFNIATKVTLDDLFLSLQTYHLQERLGSNIKLGGGVP